MPEQAFGSNSIDPVGDDLVLIVVGAHLEAEIADRPLAYRLRDRIEAMQAQQSAGGGDGIAPNLRPVVCSDVWYLNDASLLARPAIAIGDPAVNAATAYLCNRLPTAFLLDNAFRIHLDPEFVNVQACAWGVDHHATAAAIEAFADRYLGAFLESAGD